MKTSNIIIISTIVVFIIGFAINAAGLKKMYDRTNWNDPYRQLQKYPLNNPIKNVYIITSSDYHSWNSNHWSCPLTVMQGNSNMLMISDTANVKWQVTDSNLFIRFRSNGNAVLILPKLQMLSTNAIDCVMNGFNLDTLHLAASESQGRISVVNSKFKYLDASTSKTGTIRILSSNQIAKLNLILRGGTFSSEIGSNEVTRSISPNSTLELSGNALQWIAQKK